MTGNKKLYPLCINCMAPAGFEFAVYRWFAYTDPSLPCLDDNSVVIFTDDKLRWRSSTERVCEPRLPMYTKRRVKRQYWNKYYKKRNALLLSWCQSLFS